ncbi:hypothetical protein HDZ31DRAFT_80118 [Schizophyllum fasciatum]
MPGPRRKSGKLVTLPANPTFLDFQSTDGDSRRGPPADKTVRTVNDKGHVDYYRYVPVDSPEAIRWRVDVGAGVAKVLNLPTGPNYVLRGWPDGYSLYCHEKGPDADPRHDYYLMGSAKRFRSFREFIEHAKWLMEGTVNPCKCKNCSGRSQKEISEDLAAAGVKMKALPATSSPLKAKTSRSPSKTPAKAASNRARTSMPPPPPPPPPAPSPLAQPPLMQAPPPAPAALQPGHISVPENPLLQMAILPDDCTASADEPLDSQRAIELDDALSPNHAGSSRWYRLGEVVWCKLDPSITGDGPPIEFWPCVVTSTAAEIAGGDNSGYQVRCIVDDNARIAVSGSRILPYLAYSPTVIVDWALDRPPATLDLPLSELATFDPFTPSRNYMRGVSACLYAIQVGAQLADFWSPSNEYDTSPQIPHAAPSHPAMPGPSNSTAPMQSAPNTFTPPRSAVPRYQGIWWGPERIWAGDLVRLRLPRSALAPHGVPHLLPASGIGHDTLAYLAGMGIDPLSHNVVFGVQTRATFLRIARLGAAGRECCAAGTLYELADGDVEPGPWDASEDAPPLPAEPVGFKWRRITEPGFVAAVPLALLSGRYYARLLHHPLLGGVLAAPEELTVENPVLSLEGLVPAGNIDVERFQMDRGSQLASATNEAAAMLRSYFEGCKLPVDIVLMSSDGEMVGAHARNLEAYGEGFPSMNDGIGTSEPVQLTESVATLKTLLGFMHLGPQPRVRDLSCQSKYGVHSATQVCAMVLESEAKDRPAEILKFGLRHGYKDLANAAAPHTLQYSVEEMQAFYKDYEHVLMRWLLYCARWEDLTRRAAKLNYWHIHRGGNLHCGDWADFWIPVLSDLVLGGKSAIYGGMLQRTVDWHLYRLNGCEYCCADVQIWLGVNEEKAQKLVEEGIVGCYHQASDGKHLGAHACSLATYGEAFPAVDGGVVTREPVGLVEDAATLRRLLAFMHLAPQPRIRALSCTEVLRLAEAAEKYIVHSATQVCAIVLESKVEEEPAMVLRFALKHGHPELANAAAPHTLKYTTNEMRTHYGTDDYALMKWLLYCTQWEDLTRRASQKSHWRAHRGGMAHCEHWPRFWVALLGDLIIHGKNAIYGGKLTSIADGRVAMLHGCEYCTPDVKHWVSTWEKEAQKLAAEGIV